MSAGLMSAYLVPIQERRCRESLDGTGRPLRPLSIRANAQRHPEAQQEQPSAALLAAALVTPWLLGTGAAQAVDGEFGLLEGRTAALIHPALMAFLFGASLYAGYLGLQWRRIRELGTKVKELKDQLPKPDAEGNRPASPLESEVKALEQERKQLIQSKPAEKHFNWGSLLLGIGVAISIEGPVNTWMRTGKLFPGPHLYAGAMITVLWGLSAALVPAMQKGNDNARTAHIALNTVNLLLFASQIPTGLEIVGKASELLCPSHSEVTNSHGITGQLREHYKSVVAGLGACYSGSLQAGYTTHLVVAGEVEQLRASAKVHLAQATSIPLVSLHWLDDSQADGLLLDHESYLVGLDSPQLAQLLTKESVSGLCVPSLEKLRRHAGAAAAGEFLDLSLGPGEVYLNGGLLRYKPTTKVHLGENLASPPSHSTACSVKHYHSLRSLQGVTFYRSATLELADGRKLLYQAGEAAHGVKMVYNLQPDGSEQHAFALVLSIYKLSGSNDVYFEHRYLLTAADLEERPAWKSFLKETVIRQDELLLTLGSYHSPMALCVDEFGMAYTGHAQLKSNPLPSAAGQYLPLLECRRGFDTERGRGVSLRKALRDLH
ncbi:hypothetical protein N2152v2_002229 [Parachlorella kessleri]